MLWLHPLNSAGRECGQCRCLEFESQHELDLPRESRADVIGKEVVVVVVEAIYGRDLPEASAARRGTHKRSRLRAIEVESQIAGIGKLSVVEDVECLHRELHPEPLGKFGFFQKLEVNLPDVRGSNQSVRLVAVAREYSRILV